MPLLTSSLCLIIFYASNFLLHCSHIVTTSIVHDLPHNNDLHAVVNEHKKKKSEGDI
jgi:hypothetical protein